ncbi:MAG TPA: OmpA family protein [Nitrospiraceae bacterium]|nr:OmpA family protein [Nitrospiraceae bacterium]
MIGYSRRYGKPALHATTIGVTDLMTSLAVVFILLLTVYITRSAKAESHAQDQKANIKAVLHDRFSRFGLSLDTDPRDPLAILMVVPDNMVNFEFGKSALPATASAFLEETMPFYASVVCGPLRESIDSVVIEGHTDDFGSDTLNLKLSQDRSFSVMVKALEIIQTAQPSASQCFQQVTSASGRGKQDLIYEDGQVPNREKSRRVVFKIRLRSIEQRRPLADIAALP